MIDKVIEIMERHVEFEENQENREDYELVLAYLIRSKVTMVVRHCASCKCKLETVGRYPDILAVCPDCRAIEGEFILMPQGGTQCD